MQIERTRPNPLRSLEENKFNIIILFSSLLTGGYAVADYVFLPNRRNKDFLAVTLTFAAIALLMAVARIYLNRLQRQKLE